MDYLSVNHFYNMLKTSLEIKNLKVDELEAFIENSLEYMEVKIDFDFKGYDDTISLTNDLLNLIDTHYL